MVELLRDPTRHFRPAPESVIGRIGLQSLLKSCLLLIVEDRSLPVFSAFIEQPVDWVGIVPTHQLSNPVGSKAHQVGDFATGIVFV